MIIIRTMKYRTKNLKFSYRVFALTLAASTVLTFTGCGKDDKPEETEVTTEVQTEAENANASAETDTSEVTTESGSAAQAVSLNVDVASLQQQNEDVVAWLNVPGTEIDAPIMQSMESSDFYMHHDSEGKDDENGAVYIDMPAMPDMSDFNTVIHGSKALFGELINYENPDYFEKNSEFYVYTPDNVLTYTVFAVFRRENNSLIREYSFVDAVEDRRFLDDVYNGKIIGKQIREGWYELNEYNFLATLTIDDPDANDQLVVIGALSNDAAGSMDRQVIEELQMGPSLLEE